MKFDLAWNIDPIRKKWPIITDTMPIQEMTFDTVDRSIYHTALKANDWESNSLISDRPFPNIAYLIEYSTRHRIIATPYALL